MAYPEMGYLPEALINQLVLLGWTPGDNKEIVSVEEIIRTFDLCQVHRSNARFDMNKLKSINYEYMRQLSMERFVELGRKAFERTGMLSSGWNEEYVKQALETCKDKVKTFSVLLEYAGFYFAEELVYPPEMLESEFTQEARERLAMLRERYTGLEDFSSASLEASLKALAKELGLKAGPLVHPLRLALTAAKSGPSLYHLMEVLGKERVLKRINGLLK